MSPTPELNPYARYLAGQEPLPVLAATPVRLDALACGMTPEQLDAPPAPGKWSPREILAHLADCELVFCFRLRQTLAAHEDLPHPVIQPFDQDLWAHRYAAYDVPSALALFRAAREWNLRLLAGASAADMDRITTHPERGTMTFRTILETMAGHDINHLRQLEAIAAG
jgi:uncharacterized damage-inducible protein DinB